MRRAQIMCSSSSVWKISEGGVLSVNPSYCGSRVMRATRAAVAAGPERWGVGERVGGGRLYGRGREAYCGREKRFKTSSV